MGSEAALPSFLFVETTTECHLRCKHCLLWTSHEPSTSLATDEKVRLVREFGEWRRSAGAEGGTLVLTGGEPFRKPDEVLALGRAARDVGLNSVVNTSGTRFGAVPEARWLTEGPSHIIVSLDSHDPRIHDWSRGNRGTWETAVSGLRTLLDGRAAQHGCDSKLLTSTIIYKRNYRELPELVSFLRGLGVDGALFQPLTRTFANTHPTDPFFENELPDDPDAVAAAVEYLKSEKRKDGFIVTGERDLDWVRLYFEDPDSVREQVCGSAQKNMMVDQMGEVQLCFGMRALNEGRALGSVRTSSLRELWEGTDAQRMRGVMSVCRRSCGMLNCHRRSDA